MTGKRAGNRRSAFQEIQQKLKVVDLIFEVCDARLPVSSRHSFLRKVYGAKPTIIVLSKADLANPQQTDRWLKFLNHQDNTQAIALALKQAQGKNKIVTLALSMTMRTRETRSRKGILPQPIRACVVGMPNVGKSSFINWLVGQKAAKVGNTPGITKGQQWIRIHPQLELLDTPGVLPSMSMSPDVETKLSIFRLLPDKQYDSQIVAEAALKLIAELYPEQLEKYGVNPTSWDTGLHQHATNRKFLAPGGTLDIKRAASSFLSDVESGKFGKITLDLAPNVS